MKAHFKVIAWVEVDIPEDLEEEIKAKFISGEYKTAQDIFDDYPEAGVEYTGLLEGTEEELSPEENNGESTIELLSYNEEETYWKNGEI